MSLKPNFEARIGSAEITAKQAAISTNEDKSVKVPINKPQRTNFVSKEEDESRKGGKIGLNLESSSSNLFIQNIASNDVLDASKKRFTFMPIFVTECKAHTSSRRDTSVSIRESSFASVSAAVEIQKEGKSRFSAIQFSIDISIDSMVLMRRKILSSMVAIVAPESIETHFLFAVDLVREEPRNSVPNRRREGRERLKHSVIISNMLRHDIIIHLRTVDRRLLETPFFSTRNQPRTLFL